MVGRIITYLIRLWKIFITESIWFSCHLCKDPAGWRNGYILSAGWCNGYILASHAADWGSIPGCGRSASHQTVSGTASAGDAHSLVRRTNPPTASSVPRYGVAQGYRKGDEHLRQSQKMGATWPCILYLVFHLCPSETMWTLFHL